jgi:N-acyl-D-aspartate/D-glutamate deacylase
LTVDLIINGGTIVDGTGGEPFRGDVAIRSGRIIEIGTFPRPEGVQTLDARGLVVAPGFIDIHSHSDFTLFVDPRAVSSLAQGVTLEVVGNCGHGCAPITTPELFQHNIYGYEPGSEIPWRSVGQYLDTLQARGPALNVIVLVPNGCLRLAAVADLNRPATAGEVAQMRKLLEQSLEEGAWGYSTGLEYGTERACSEEEVVALCNIASKAGGFYATHTRNRHGEAEETIAEAIRAGEAAQVPLQISHISSVSRLDEKRRWAIEQAVEQVHRARARGLDVCFDMHTRSFGMTNLSNVLPPWVVDGTPDEIATRLQKPATREQVKTHPSIVSSLARTGGWTRMVVYNCQSHPELSRKSIAEIAGEWGLDPFDTICQVLMDEKDAIHSVLVLGYVYPPEDTHFVFDDPFCLVGSDATALAPDKPLRGALIHGAFTWAAWFYRHFVRDTKRLSVQESVRRLTGLPAERLGLNDRGTLRVGAWADMALFDPQRFAERGTDFEPDQIAQGMTHVLVNGTLALQNGFLTGNRSGHVLRHQGTT